MTKKTKLTLTSYYNYVWNELHLPPEKSNLNPIWGLCINLTKYHEIMALKTAVTPDATSLKNKLFSQLKKAFPNSLPPFDAFHEDYIKKRNKFTNYKRLYWIYSHTRGIPMKEFGEVSSYEVPPQVASIGNRFCIIGTEYGHVHKADGTIRTWKTKSSAMKFLKQYCYFQEEMKNV